MTLQQVLNIGSRLYRHLGDHQGRLAIYPTKDDDGNWFLRVVYDSDLVLSEAPEEFGSDPTSMVPVRYETY